jgi:NAD-dependent deacetylase
MKRELYLRDSVLDRLRAAARWVVLTGAGISAESGVPTFRGPGGLWEGSRPEDLASVQGFQVDPARVWRWYRWRRGILAGVQPNAWHRALVRLETGVRSFCLATQNVDGLHAIAGSRQVLELHGNVLRSRCFEECGRESVEDPGEAVPRCLCGAPLRPDVVWFGEMLSPSVLERAFAEAAQAEVCLIVGTSGIVYPAAALPEAARRAGALVMEVNTEETALSPLCDAVLRGPAADLLPAIIEEIGFGEEPADRPGV